MNNTTSISAPIITMDRHRLTTDGEGVTTLVIFARCPLHCRYCINDYCHTTEQYKIFTPSELYRHTVVDQLYFLATGGGITFGGGEPALHADFIVAFRDTCGPQWHLNLESSLHVPTAQIEKLIPVIDHYIIDIKDLNPDIYRRYTLCEVDLLMDNLRLLCQHGLQDRVTLRLPLIPEHNTDEDRDRSEQILREMGFTHFDRFEYTTRIHTQENTK